MAHPPPVFLLSFQGRKNFLHLPKMDASADTLIDTGGSLPPVDPMIAKVAFLRHPLFYIELHHSKRAGGDASLAPGTHLWINEYNAVGPLKDGIHRASLFTGRLRTVETTGRRINQPQLAIDSLNPLSSHLNPSRTFGRVVFLLAGKLARMASPAEVIVDEHSKFLGHGLFLNNSPFPLLP